jgi:CheY-like chemotaxis protein
MKKDRILWADDEIDLLKVYVLFLEEKGYEVVTATNGKDAVELVPERDRSTLFFSTKTCPDLADLKRWLCIKDIDP